METIRYGVIGLGNMGLRHVEWLSKQIKGAALTAICDVKEERLADARERCGGIAREYTDYHALLNCGEIDVVLIATPHYLHPVIAKEAFALGLNVLTEKPAGVYTKAVREMNEAAEKSGKLFGIMYNQRVNPVYQKAREMVQNGELGELKRCVWIITNWYRSQMYYNSGGWRATWAGEGGGVLLNQCPHNLDLWQWIFGLPKRVRASCYTGKYHDIEVEDDVTIYAEYENGATASFITSTGECPGTNRLEISGDRGKIVIEDNILTFWKLDCAERKFCFESTEAFATPKTEKIVIDTSGENLEHRGILQNFTDALLFGTPLLAPGEEGIRGLEISNAAFLSSWTDDWVQIPVDEDKFYSLLKQRIASSKEKENVVEVVSDTAGSYGS